jgi:hypothetical protein
MGLILNDNNKGLHAEARRESFVLYTDMGEDSIELAWELLDELELLVTKLKTKRPPNGTKGPAMF